MYAQIIQYTNNHQVTLVAVSKTQSIATILSLYDQGQRIFGENRVQELCEKQEAMPKDVQWHLIGHLQKNKVKYIAPFVSMIHSVDSFELLEVINTQANKNNRTIPVLLQFHIAQEETKFGLDIEEAKSILEKIKESPLPNIKIYGVMGMASFTEDQNIIRKEFRTLRGYFELLKDSYFSNKDYFKEISMGMSSDYKIAIEEGSTMVRIGSALFR